MASDKIISKTSSKVIIKVDRIGEVLSEQEALLMRQLINKLFKGVK